MKKLFYPVVAALLLITSAFVSVTSQDWKIDESFSIKFTSKDPSGIFKVFTGAINFDENDLASSRFDLSIDVNSISMGNGMKNKKSLSPEWFDAEKYPTIKYTSSKVEKSGSGYMITGDLKIKGTSKQYKIPFDFKRSGESGKFTGSFDVNRMDFKIGKSSGAVPDIMKVDFSVPVNKK